MEQTNKYIRLYNNIFPNLRKIYIFEVREGIVCGLIHLNSLSTITENTILDFINLYSDFRIDVPDYENNYIAYDINFYSETSYNSYLLISNTRYYVRTDFFHDIPNDIDENGLCFLFYWGLCRVEEEGVELPFVTRFSTTGETTGDKIDIMFDWRELHDYYVACKVKEMKMVMDENLL